MCWEIAFWPILSNAGWSDEAAKMVSGGYRGSYPVQVEPPHPVTRTTASTATTALVTGQLHSDVGRFHDRHRRHAWLELQLVDRLAREQRNKTVRTRLDLYLRRDPDFDDSRDDPGKTVARRLSHEDVWLCPALRLRDACQRGAVDEPLSTRGSRRDEPPIVDHAPHSVGADAQHLGGLTKSIIRHTPRKPSICQLSSATPGLIRVLSQRRTGRS